MISEKTKIKREKLTQALHIKSMEIADYQINIDSFQKAIDKIASLHPNDREMEEFSSQLSLRLRQERFEQKKAIIMHSVIEDQLNEMEACK